MHFEQSTLFADKSRTAHSQNALTARAVLVLTRHRLRFRPFFGNCWCVFFFCLQRCLDCFCFDGWCGWDAHGYGMSMQTPHRYIGTYTFDFSLYYIAVSIKPSSMIIIRFGKQVGCFHLSFSLSLVTPSKLRVILVRKHVWNVRARSLHLSLFFAPTLTVRCLFCSAHRKQN